MLLILHFFFGIISSFLGSLAPSMLNMTAAKISIKSGNNDAKKFALGASMIVFIQAYIALLFAKYLRTNPGFVQALQQITLIIFILLSIYFYKQYKVEKNLTKKVNQRFKNSFIVGIFLSSLNMFSIPFYCGVSTALDVIGWFEFSTEHIISFVIGSSIGSFLLLYMYAHFASLIQSKAQIITKNLNLILSILTGGLAFVTFIILM